MYRLFFGIFFLSGVTGLIYESVWAQYLKQILGHAAYAQTIVLIIFMGGMAGGSWLAGRRSTRLSRPLKTYAAVEAGIGVLGVVFHGIFLLATPLLFDALLPAIDSPWLANTAKWSIAGLLILPQSILLGTTFPLMSVGMIRLLPHDSGNSLGMLYFTNSIGAVAGVLLAAFWLIPAIGLPGAIASAGVLNLLLALAAWRIAEQPALHADPIPPRDTATHMPTLFISAAFVTGMASFFYEIGWIRMLSLVLGSTVQAFELMLAAFIAGLAFGGLWIRKRLDRIERLRSRAGIVQLLMGALALLTLPAYGLTYDVMAWLLSAVARSEGGYLLFNAASMGLAAFIMVPATFMAGMALPLFTQAAIKTGAGESGVGLAYAANTVGAIVGVMLAVHVFMPMTGTRGIIIAGAVFNLALGMLLVYRDMNRRHAAALGGACVLFLCAAVAWFDVNPRNSASGVYRYGVAELSQTLDVLFYEDGKTATIAVLSDADGAMSITTNGKPDAKINPVEMPHAADEVTMVMLAALPLAVSKDARHVANIGMGSGLTTHVLLADPGIETVETIEIEARMVEGARFFGDRVARAWYDPRSAIRIDDAKSYFSTHDKRYDIIVSEPSNPWVSGVSSLFSREFYRHIKRHLADGGMLVQWLQLYETNMENVVSVLKALSQEFPAYDIYSADDGNVMIVATQERDVRAPDEEVFDKPALREHLRRVGLHSIADIRARWVGSERQFNLLLQTFDVPVNSDFHPFLEYSAPRSRFLGEHVDVFAAMRDVPVPVLGMLTPFKWSPDDVWDGDDVPFLYSQRIADARELAAFVLDGRLPGDAASTPWAAAFELARLAARDCSVPAMPDLLAAHYRLAAIINPYLGAARATAVWDRIAPRRCHARWPAAVGQWLDVHRAVAARDAREMLRTGQAVLDRGVQLDSVQENYLRLVMLTAAAAAAAVADDSGVRVARYWLQRDGEAVHGDLLLRMLALQALDAAAR